MLFIMISFKVEEKKSVSWLPKMVIESLMAVEKRLWKMFWLFPSDMCFDDFTFFISHNDGSEEQYLRLQG